MLDKIFIPIRKVNEEQRLVYGTLAAEVPDHVGEILDYEASKKAFETWRDHYQKVTNGKSSGNLRVQHTEKIAGHFVQVEFDDETKSIPVVAKVTDDDTWKHVMEGDLTGFSIGARGGKREKDATNPKLTRYVVSKMVEGSLVDAPCIPTATFEVVRSDGQVEVRKFNVAESTNTPKTQYDLAVTPTFTSAFKTVVPQLQKVGSADLVLANLKVHAQSAGLRKSLWEAADMAQILMAINAIRMNLKYEAEWEADNSPVPEKLRSWLDEGAAIFQELVSEETAELTADAPSGSEEVMELADTKIEVAKSDEPKEAPMAEETKKAEEVTTEEVTKTEEVKTEEVVKTEQVDLQKSLDSAMEQINKFDGVVSKLSSKLEEQEAKMQEQANTLKTIADSVQTLTNTLKNTPAPVKGVMTVTKSEDSVNSKQDEPTDVHSELLKALNPKNGKSIVPDYSRGVVVK